MKYEYGQTSEKTQRIKRLVECVSQLGRANYKTLDDVRALQHDIEQNYNDIDDVFVSISKSLLSSILTDGKISDEEKSLLSKFGSTFDNPVSGEPVTAIEGKTFVLSGDFEIKGGKGLVEKIIKESGGFVRAKVSSKTDYVVVGKEGSDAWGFGNFGQKIKDALERIFTQTGKAVIVSENAFFEFVQSSSPDASQTLEEQQGLFRKQQESVKVVATDFRGLTEGQQEFLDLVAEGKNIYLAGLGGTGKSYVLDLLIKRARNQGQNVLPCAPTGIAALNIGGSTIHRALGIKPEKTLYPEIAPWIDDDSALLSCDLIIVDEISMCRMDLFDYLSVALKKAGEMRKKNRPLCQMVVVGDFSQLPPVVPKEERKILEDNYGYEIGGAYPFMGKEWDSWNFQKIELTETIRQRDASFAKALNACRVGDTSGLRWIEEHACKTIPKHAITLCGRNEEADNIDKDNLANLPAKTMFYHADINGEVKSEDMPTLTVLELKQNARVMALVNESPKTYMNGSLGTVRKCFDTHVEVAFDNGATTNVYPHRWKIEKPKRVDGKVVFETIGTFEQIPLKLAYALTIHKSQGQTFDAVSVHPACWDPGQLYTALSRVTTIAGLHLAHHCQDTFLITSKEVLDFYDNKPIARKMISQPKDIEKRKSTKQVPDDFKRSLGNSDIEDNATNNETVSRPPRSWTKEEEAFLLDNIDKSNRDLATILNRTVKSVEHKKSKLIAKRKKDN